jgi:hypothetical protein
MRECANRQIALGGEFQLVLGEWAIHGPI